MTRRGQILRLILAVLFTCSIFMVVGWKFCKLHLDPNLEMVTRVKEERRFETKTRGQRGSIYAAGGGSEHVLAMDISCATVAVDPVYARQRGRNPIRLASLLQRTLKLTPKEHGDLQNFLITAEKTRYKVVKKNVDFKTASALRAMISEHRLRSIIVKDEYDRSYPKDRTASHVLGFATINGGVMGIESAMNSHLTGQEGRLEGRLTGIRREVVTDRTVDIRPSRGHNVHLTLNVFVQQAMEEALNRAMREYRPDGAWAVCMETKTGAILGLASRPDFNPNTGGEFFEKNKEMGRNRCLSYGFEPGSVIKPIAIAASMNEGLVNPRTTFNCEKGQWRHAGHLLRDAGRAFDSLTVERIVMKSSNIGTAKTVLQLAGGGRDMRLGMKRLSDYYHDFGLGERTGLGLPHEDPCPIPDYRKWSNVRLSRVAIGQGIRINAVQLCSAVNTIANDGMRMQPYIIDRVEADNGDVIRQARPKAVQQVIRPAVAHNMRLIMRKTVMSSPQDCTGHRARLDSYETAGKTGTAQKYIYEAGRYSNTRNISSFVGFVPAMDPVFTLVVILDEPKAKTGAKQLGGGSSAAPVFKDIASATAHFLGVKREEGAPQQASFSGLFNDH